MLDECSTAADALTRIAELRPDVLFVDVALPDQDAFEMLDAIPAALMPIIVFLGGDRHHIERALEANAVDVIAKPFDAHGIRTALCRVRRELGRDIAPDESTSDERATTSGAATSEMTTDAPAGVPALRINRGRIVVRVDGRIVLLRLSDIEHIESHGNYVKLFVGTQTLVVRGSLLQFEGALDSMQFIRIHRTVIINLDYIAEIVPSLWGEHIVRLVTGVVLKMSRTYRAQLEDRLGVRAKR